MTGDLFTPQASADPIGAATRKGATFSRMEPDPAGNTWMCSAPVKRGQQLPIVIFHGSSQESVATAFCHYFHIKA